MSQKLRLMRFPPEIRIKIYKLLFEDSVLLVNQPICKYVDNKLELDRNKIFSRNNRPPVLLIDPEICQDAMPHFSRLVKPIAFGPDPSHAYTLVPQGYLKHAPIIGVDMSCQAPISKSIVPSMMELRIHVCEAYRTGTLNDLEVFEYQTDRGIAETIIGFWDYLEFDLDDDIDPSLDADLHYSCRLCKERGRMSDVVVYPEYSRLVETHERAHIEPKNDCETEEPEVDPPPCPPSLMYLVADDQSDVGQSDMNEAMDWALTIAEDDQAAADPGAVEETQVDDGGQAAKQAPELREDWVLHCLTLKDR